MTKTFADRCKMFEQCLPDASYRDLLKELHTEMLAKLAEQPAQQEPVAWMQDSIELYVQDRPGASYTIPLYTTPQAQPAREFVGLTDEEIDDLSRTMVKGNKSVNWLCRAIEAAHNIKENT